jgi:hypothetical protein
LAIQLPAHAVFPIRTDLLQLAQVPNRSFSDFSKKIFSQKVAMEGLSRLFVGKRHKKCLWVSEHLAEWMNIENDV